MILLDLSALQRARLNSADDAALTDAIRQLKTQTDAIAAQPFATVMDKNLVAASGDKHDYFSFGPYWWPNPATADGLPYVRRDGLHNPKSENSDRPALAALTREVEALALAYFYDGKESLAGAATRRLRAWFLDPATRMNPHLQFGQAIPGVTEGRGIGIIDTIALRLLPDAIEMLRPSAHWTDSDETGVKSWLGEFLDWLLESEHGKREAGERNNHGSWYDAQVVALALFAERPDVARGILENVAAKRFAAHIAPDGSQPHELARTRSFSYSCYNLAALFDLARMGEEFELDLWNWQSADGASLRRALEFLAPYADAEKLWPFEQVIAQDGGMLWAMLRRAERVWPDGNWREFSQKIEATAQISAQLRLSWPRV